MSKTTKETEVAAPKLPEIEGVEFHLDKDPNDPRNLVPAVPGPSLNDPSWQNVKSEDKE